MKKTSAASVENYNLKTAWEDEGSSIIFTIYVYAHTRTYE